MITFTVDDLKEMKTRLTAFSEFLKTMGIDDDDIFASKLVSCELITNVIRHGGGEAAEFTGELLSDKIAITVKACCQEGIDVVTTLPDVFAENGRGLYIIRSVCFGDIERGDGGALTVYIKRTH